MNARELIQKKVVLLDGAMGTMLQNQDCYNTGDCPELLNITNPDIITAIHKQYIDAGAQIVYTNTFGANRKKLPKDYSPEQVITAAISAAKKAVANTNCLIALDLGPIGELLEPLGKLSFEDAYELYAEQIRHADGADLIAIETLSDLYEMKAAVLAAKENSDLPIVATMTFESTKRTFMGCSLGSMAVTLEGLGVDALGINCSLSPENLIPHIEELRKYTNLPLAVKANAGLPDSNGSFNTDIDIFTAAYRRFIELGVSIIGGCCGTTPEYIKSLSQFAGKDRIIQNIPLPSMVCTPSKLVTIDSPKIIGERLNPTGKKLMKQALLNGDDDYIKSQANEQIAAGADILDLNCGLPQLNEAVVMPRLVRMLQSFTDLPLQIDSSDAKTIENSLRIYNGKPIVNSINGDEETLDEILPIVKKYGAAVVALTLDKNGIPKTLEQRTAIAERIIQRAKQHGINKRDIFIDPLTLTVSAEPEQAKITLAAIKHISQKMNMNTVLGISNVSFGLPNRNLINSAFLLSALNNGLTLPIINPNIKENIDAIRAYKVLNGLDEGCTEYLAAYAENVLSAETSAEMSIEYCVLNGLKKQCADVTAKLLITLPPLTVVNEHLIPALDKVGELYEQGKLYLPQLIMCAETAKCGFNEINKAMSKNNAAKKYSILLATVKGDVHDIGKNIVKVVLENYGYDIIDLGKNVEINDILDAISEHNVKLVGLSALMTTTAVNMEKTVNAIRHKNLDCKIMVGGAVITQSYATAIGADFYAKDANEAVRIAKSVFIQ